MVTARILIVEDESIVALDLSRSLESLGYTVVGQAARGPDAIRAAGDLRPDLVLMDIRLKGDMDGIEAAEKIRSSYDIPVIFLTAHTDENTLLRARVTEPFGYILKPFEERSLVSNISIALYKHTSECELRRSEIQYRTLFETMAQGVVYQDAEGKIISANPAAERILGMSLDQMQGRTSMDPRWQAIHPDGSDFPGDSHPAWVALHTGQEVRNVVMGLYNPQKADYVWISVNARPLLDEGAPNPYQVFTTFEDITAIQKAEASLQASEERYRGVIENSSDAIVLVDANAVVIEWNKTAEQITGLHRDQALSQYLWDIFYRLNPEEQPTPALYRYIKKSVNTLFSTRQILEELQLQETVIQRADGTCRTIQSHSFFIDSKQGVLLASIIRDITERKRTEVELRKLSQAVAQSANIVVITDLQGRIEYVNPKFEEATGYSAEETLGQNPRILKSDEQSVEFYRDLWKTIKSGQVWRGEFHNKRKDGSLFWEWATIAPVMGENGAITHFIAIKEDITARKAAEEAEREQRLLAEALRNSAEALSSTLKFDDVLERILNNIGQVVPYDAVAIVLLEEGRLRIVRHRGWVEGGRGGMIHRADLKLDDFPDLQSIYTTHETIIVTDVAAEAHLSKFPETHWVRSFAGIPIFIRDQVMGFLILLSAKPNFYTQTHTVRLNAFASQAAVAIEHARLFEQTHYFSITDGLTGLFNSRYFFNLAYFEFDRSRRYKGNLSVMMLDIDYFKAVNDTYGHPVGDIALRQIARLIQSSIRKVDVVARYGGEEFVMLMPETDREEAGLVTERLRKIIAETPVLVEEHSISITVSIGIATLGPEHADFNALVKCADDALYVAKAAGRNQVSIWQGI